MTHHDRHSLCDTGVHVCTLEEGRGGGRGEGGEREGRGGEGRGGEGRGGEGRGGGGTQSDMLHEIQHVMVIDR